MINDSSIAESMILRQAPNLSREKAHALALIWAEVVHRIIGSILAKDDSEAPLHFNVRAEMSLDLSKMLLFLTEAVIKKRVDGRPIEDISPEAEALACLEGDGVSEIESTADNLYPWWRDRMDVRWLPKSSKALEKDTQPRRMKPLAVKPVRDKHFISRWFIRDFWADGPSATRWRKAGGSWTRRQLPFGRWGHKVGLWDDRVEAWFSLIEGDGKRPIEMLMKIEPLNPPQQQALVAFLIIHMIRNPSVVEGLRWHLRDVLEAGASETGMSFDDMARAAYASLFGDSELYRAWAEPVFVSQWAIVASDDPVFVLPDTFCARGILGDTTRIIVPLTPPRCFVTLAATEDAKRIVPFNVKADARLARRISALLVESAQSEFLSHRDVVCDAEPMTADFANVIAEIGDAVAPADRSIRSR